MSDLHVSRSEYSRYEGSLLGRDPGKKGTDHGGRYVSGVGPLKKGRDSTRKKDLVKGGKLWRRRQSGLECKSGRVREEYRALDRTGEVMTMETRPVTEPGVDRDGRGGRQMGTVKGCRRSPCHTFVVGR